MNCVDNVHNAKIALNKHLLIWLRNSPGIETSIQYQCLSYNDTYHSVNVKLGDIYSISIGREQNGSQLYFVAIGVMNTIAYISKISISCVNNQTNEETIFFNGTRSDTFTKYLIGNCDPHGRFAFASTHSVILFYNLIDLTYWSKNITWPNPNRFHPIDIDIMTPFVYIIGHFISGGDTRTLYVQVRLYLIMITFNNSQYNIDLLNNWSSNDFPIAYPGQSALAICVNHYDGGRTILVGVPPLNTIYVLSLNSTAFIRLQLISSKTQIHSGSQSGYGAGFTWLNQGKILVVLDANIGTRSYSTLNYYDMLEHQQITNETIELSVFPDNENVYPQKFSQQDIYIISSISMYSTLYVYNYPRNLLIIPPSLPGYYSVHYLSTKYNNTDTEIISFVPNSVQCHPGTYKNDIGVWPCSTCQSIETNISIYEHPTNENISYNCPQCTNKTACPLEMLTEINWLNNIEQNGIYPESPEMDIFDDILLIYIFKTNWNIKSPFLISLIVLLIILIITGLINLLKISERFASKQKYLIKFIQRFDFIGQGKFWFGGLISIAILFLGIYALKFGYAYHDRYPIEKHFCDENNSCEANNAKFETSLQLLGASLEQYEPIFHLLDSQEFHLSLELFNTLIHCGQVNLTVEVDNSFLPFTCYTNDLILYLSTKLPLHRINIKLNLFSSYTVESIRIGLSGLDAHSTNNYRQSLHFSSVLNQTNHILSYNPIINIQLTKSINITESLTGEDQTTYTGLWLPTFDYDINQMFTSLNASQSTQEILVSIRLSKTAFFIKNKQKPVARKSEILFHAILFIGVCIDLTCMILLILKLWFIPIFIYLINKMFHSNTFIHRLIQTKRNSLDVSMLKMQEQMDLMSKRIDSLMKSIHELHESKHDKIEAIVANK